MQTFLPWEDFHDSAHVLDDRRLGKQRVEALQILNQLDDRSDKNGWRNHPAVRMWRGYPLALIDYVEAICTEWIRRGHHDTIFERMHDYRWHGLFEGNQISDEMINPPPWLGDEAFHLSHRSNLVRKMPEHYGVLFPGVPDDLPYVWPV